MSNSLPELDTEHPLGEGEAIAFYMRLDILRPFELYLVDNTNGIRSISEGFLRSDVGPSWLPDGTQLVYRAVHRGTSCYYLVDADGANRREIMPDEGHKHFLRWSPDGSRLAFLMYPRQADGSISSSPFLSVTDLMSGDTVQVSAGYIQDLVWLPDGQSLLAIVRADDGLALELYDAAGNHERRLSEADYLRDAVGITISRDARKVAYVSSVMDGSVEPLTESLTVSALDGLDAK